MSWFKKNVRIVLFVTVLLLAAGTPVQARVVERAVSAECAAGFPLIWQWFIQLFTRYAMAAN